MSEVSKGVTEQIKHLEYTRDVVHAHSKGVKKLIDLAIAYIYDMEKEGVEGKRKVAWAGGLSETPLFYACDTTPLALSELGRLGTPEAMEVAENDFQMPREACSMVKVLIGEYYLRRNSPIKKIMFRGSACEPIGMCSEILTNYGYDVKLIDSGFRTPEMSQDRYNTLVEHFKKEVLDAAEWLNDGKPLDKEKLRLEMKKYNSSMRKVRTIMNLRREHNVYIKSLPAMFIILGSTHYFGRYDEYIEALDLIIEEMSVLQPGEFDENLVRLVWGGGRGMEFGVYEAIDDAGACIMGWNLLNTFEVGFDETIEDPLDQFVTYQIGGKNAGTVEAGLRAMEYQIKKAKATGILLYGYVGCSAGSVVFELQREHFKKMGIPTMNVLGSFQVGPPTGQLVTRVKAFIEMLS